MLTLIREGGVPVWFVLAAGLLTLLSASYYLMRGDAPVRAMLPWLVVTTLCASVTAAAADLGATFHAVGEHNLSHGDMLVGLGESMSPLIMGGALITVALLLSALGARRHRALVHAS